MSLRQLWSLDPSVTFLNHGSYGATPTAVLAYQSQLRERMERQPVQFLSRDLPGLLKDARQVVAEFVGADAGDIAFLPNPTTAVNTVLRSLRFAPGDELLATDHAYNACRNALEAAAARDGARVVTTHIPFPLTSEDEVVDAVLAQVTPRTRFAMLDYVTSPTALVFPIERLVRELAARGVDTLVDGAHAPGMVNLDLRSLGAAFFTGAGHKWLCSPKGASFLYVRSDLQDQIRPLVIGHGANALLNGRTRFEAEFAWTGTNDPTAYLSLAESIRCVGALLPGGWAEIRETNRERALAGRRLLCERLGVEPPCPESMVGSIASIVLPGRGIENPDPTVFGDPLQAGLLQRHGIEVPVFPWGEPPQRLLRISAQLYNEPEEYERLADALSAELISG
jgi:isopenicillin-N epimerase